MTDTESVPASRRDVWLSIALAVAKDGLPEPEITYSHTGRTYLYVKLDRHDDARRWASHYGASTSYSERPDLNTRYVEATVIVGGWRIYIQGVEDLPAAVTPELAARVAMAILTPAAERSTVGGAA